MGPNYLKMLRLESSGDFEHLTTLVCLDIMRNLDSHPQSAKTNQIPDYEDVAIKLRMLLLVAPSDLKGFAHEIISGEMRLD